MNPPGTAHAQTVCFSPAPEGRGSAGTAPGPGMPGPDQPGGAAQQAPPARKDGPAARGGPTGDPEIDRLEQRRREKMRERFRIKEEMEALKTDQLRREMEQMRAKIGPKPDPAKEKAAAAPPAAPPGPKVHRARLRPRHVLTVLSFLLLVPGPTAATAWYLWTRAHDRYVSVAGFSVRTEEVGSAFELLGGVAELSGSSSSDTDILYSFIQSPGLVARVDAELDLRSIWSRPGWHWREPGHDPVFAYHPPGSIEDLTDYWNGMVGVYSDSGTGLIDIEVQAFAPQDAQAIARMIYDESTQMINRLSAIAREDATRYAREELDQSVERLKQAREALTRFRNRTQIVDPAASMQSQMGILSSLQAQLAQTLVDLDILRQSTSASDPRLVQAERRVEVIEARIAEERRKLGLGSESRPGAQGSEAFADLVGEYERLIVDREFAETSYTSALAAYDSAVAEARRQSRYLAAHVEPTLAESAEYPRHFQLLGLVALFSFLGWALVLLVGYSLRDRR